MNPQARTRRRAALRHTVAARPRPASRAKTDREFERVLRAPDRPKNVEADVGRLNLVVKALLNALDKRGLVSDTQLVAEMEAMDLADGRRDAMLRRREPPKVCSRCHRRNRYDIATCMYCGQDLGVGLPL